MMESILIDCEIVRSTKKKENVFVSPGHLGYRRSRLYHI